jgi:hypothetical protein
LNRPVERLLFATAPSEFAPAVTIQKKPQKNVLAKSITDGCPRCDAARSSLERVPRRSIDRLISLIWLQHRYRCRSMGCGWVGNLPARHLSANGVPHMDRHYW